MLKDVDSLEAIIDSWDEGQKRTVNALKLAIAQLNKEAFARLIRTVKTEPEAVAALKQALSDEVVYAVLRHHGLVKPSLHERVEEALESVRPALSSHGGNVELVAIEPPAVAVIRLLGACSGCPASELTLSEGVEKAIREYCPEITEIKKAKGITVCGDQVHFVSPFAASEQSDWIYALELAEVKEDEIKSIDLKGRSLILSRKGDKVVCYQNICAHLGMPLDMGSFEGGILTCPYHGFKFDTDSGECLTAPEVQLHTCAVRVKGSAVEVRLE